MRLRLGRSHLRFVGHGRALAQRGMQADGVVPALDEAETGHLGLGLGGETSSVQQLAFQGGEEALARGVVVGVTDRARGRAHAGLLAALAEGQRRVPGPLVGVVDDILGPPLAHGHLRSRAAAGPTPRARSRYRAAIRPEGRFEGRRIALPPGGPRPGRLGRPRRGWMARSARTRAPGLPGHDRRGPIRPSAAGTRKGEVDVSWACRAPLAKACQAPRSRVNFNPKNPLPSGPVFMLNTQHRASQHLRGKLAYGDQQRPAYQPAKRSNHGSQTGRGLGTGGWFDDRRASVAS